MDGDFSLWESNAILAYLSEAYADYSLSSRAPRARADIARWMFWESAHWQPVLIDVLGPHAGHVLLPQLVVAPERGPDWQRPALKALLDHLDKRFGEAAYIAGEALTIADFCIAGMTIYFRRLGFPYDAYPAFSAWYQRIHALESWRSTNVEPWT